MSFPENDTEYQENVIDKVERDGDSFTITSDGWSLWCGIDDDTQPWSSPATTSTPPCVDEP